MFLKNLIFTVDNSAEKYSEQTWNIYREHGYYNSALNKILILQ